MNDLPVGRSVDETLRLVQAFQYTDKHGEGTALFIFSHLTLSAFTCTLFFFFFTVFLLSLLET